MTGNVEIQKRDVGADFIKFAATLLVLNSHMGICYGDYSMFATGGAIGDALFFFVSGFTLFMSTRKLDFVNWYKRRLGRIYPTILAMGLIAGLVFCDKAGYIDVMKADKYWFLQCILVCYLVIYPIIKYDWKMSIPILVSIIVMLVAFFFLFDFNGQLFYGQDTYFRWIFFFSIMMVGGGALSAVIHWFTRSGISLPGFSVSLSGMEFCM